MILLMMRAVLFVAFFFLFVICLFGSIATYKEVNESKAWQKLNASVVTSSIHEQMSGESSRYCPLVDVTYDLAGTQYTHPLEISRWPCRGKREFVERETRALVPGSVVEVLVDPAKPSRVRLSSYSLGPAFYIGSVLGALAFLAAMAALFYKPGKSVSPTRSEGAPNSPLLKKEAKAKVRELLDAGIAKSEVFSRLCGRGVKDSQLAYFIASYADPCLCDEHDRKVNILITIMLASALISFFQGLYIGASLGPVAKWVFGVLATSIPLIFVWGFYNHRVDAYNAYVFLTLFNIPSQLKGFATNPAAAIIALAISFAMLMYVLYVRGKIFPDFVFLAPRKVRGKYLFSG